jgi:hypothetical protein
LSLLHRSDVSLHVYQADDGRVSAHQIKKSF